MCSDKKKILLKFQIDQAKFFRISGHLNVKVNTLKKGDFHGIPRFLSKSPILKYMYSIIVRRYKIEYKKSLNRYLQPKIFFW